MSNETITAVAAAVGAVLGVLGLLGAILVFLYRRGLLPNLLRDLGIREIAADAKAAREASERALHEVSTNGHASATNTLKDDVRDIQESFELASRERQEVAAQMVKLNQRFEAHTRGSRAEIRRVWAEIREIKAKDEENRR